MLRSTLCFIIGFCVTFSTSKIPTPLTRDIQPRIDGYAYRLPNSTRPEAYKVELSTNIHNGAFGFVGTVAIDILVLQPTPVITIHHRQLNIAFATLDSLPLGGSSIPLASHYYDPISEFLSIPLESGTLTVGSRYRLTITYTGTLRSDEAGFYRSSYVADDGTRRCEFGFIDDCFFLSHFLSVRTETIIKFNYFLY